MRGKRMYRNQSESKLYKCNFCDMQLLGLWEFNNHQIVHVGEYSYECKPCKISFPDQITLEEHQSFLHKKLFKCKTCHKSFRNNSLLVRHERSHTSKIPNRPLKCEVCSKLFSIGSHFLIHKETHTVEKPSGSDTEFSTRTSLLSHKKTNTNIHKCKICNKSFTNKANFMKHKNVHKAKKLFQCKFCYESFSVIGNLKHRTVVKHIS